LDLFLKLEQNLNMDSHGKLKNTNLARADSVFLSPKWKDPCPFIVAASRHCHPSFSKPNQSRWQSEPGEEIKPSSLMLESVRFSNTDRNPTTKDLPNRLESGTLEHLRFSRLQERQNWKTSWSLSSKWSRIQL
jgi:hypothetical protein